MCLIGPAIRWTSIWLPFLWVLGLNRWPCCQCHARIHLLSPLSWLSFVLFNLHCLFFLPVSSLSLIYFCLHHLQFSALSLCLYFFHSIWFSLPLRVPPGGSKNKLWIFFFFFPVRIRSKSTKHEEWVLIFGIWIEINWIRRSSFTDEVKLNRADCKRDVWPQRSLLFGWNLSVVVLLMGLW